MARKISWLAAIAILAIGGIATATHENHPPVFTGEVRFEQENPEPGGFAGFVNINPGAEIRQHHSRANMLELHRHDNLSNASMRFCLTNDHATTGRPELPHFVADCVQIGQGTRNQFAVGLGKLGMGSDRWFEVNGPDYDEPGVVVRSGPLKMQGGTWIEHQNDRMAAKSFLGMIRQMNEAERAEALELLQGN